VSEAKGEGRKREKERVGKSEENFGRGKRGRMMMGRDGGEKVKENMGR
jgi:hypothetical protein